MKEGSFRYSRKRLFNRHHRRVLSTKKEPEKSLVEGTRHDGGEERKDSERGNVGPRTVVAGTS